MWQRGATVPTMGPVRKPLPSLFGLVAGQTLLWLLLALPAAHARAESRGGAGAPPAGVPAPRPVAPERFKRRNFRTHCAGTRAECAAKHQAYIRYRTEQYGHFPGFGKASWNPDRPAANSLVATFMGLKVRLNKQIVPVLACIEREIHAKCATCKPDPKTPRECEKTFPYKPKRLSGLRKKNSFRGGEVSAHVYGNAIDIDPTENTCCRCVKKWRSHPLCKKDLAVHERMIMPICWVDVFERYGFHWYGRDALQDTMHFEFLGDPTRIREAAEGRRPRTE
jgi:hypothetical protein